MLVRQSTSNHERTARTARVRSTGDRKQKLGQNGEDAHLGVQPYVLEHPQNRGSEVTRQDDAGGDRVHPVPERVLPDAERAG